MFLLLDFYFFSLLKSLYSHLSMYYFPFRDADYDEFEAMLHGLSVSRPLIKAAMGFAFDKVESAKEVMLLAVIAH